MKYIVCIGYSEGEVIVSNDQNKIVKKGSYISWLLHWDKKLPSLIWSKKHLHN